MWQEYAEVAVDVAKRVVLAFLSYAVRSPINAMVLLFAAPSVLLVAPFILAPLAPLLIVPAGIWAWRRYGGFWDDSDNW